MIDVMGTEPTWLDTKTTSIWQTIMTKLSLSLCSYRTQEWFSPTHTQSHHQNQRSKCKFSSFWSSGDHQFSVLGNLWPTDKDFLLVKIHLWRHSNIFGHNAFEKVHLARCPANCTNTTIGPMNRQLGKFHSQYISEKHMKFSSYVCAMMFAGCLWWRLTNATSSCTSYAKRRIFSLCLISKLK